MSLQYIINNAQNITFNNRRLTAQTISRSGRVLTSEVAGGVPTQISVLMHGGLRYSANRHITGVLDGMDRTTEEEIDIGASNPGLSYLTEYQGNISGSQLNNITISSVSGRVINLNTSSASGSGLLFRAGDWIQPAGNYRYPYMVTQDVSFSSTSSLPVQVSRPVLAQPSYTLTGSSIVTGTSVRWHVKMLSKPSYTVVPYDRLVFNSEFELVEIII